MFTEAFFKDFNRHDSGNSLAAFPSRTNNKLHIIVTPKLDKKAITNLDSSKTSGPETWDCYYFTDRPTRNNSRTTKIFTATARATKI